MDKLGLLGQILFGVGYFTPFIGCTIAAFIVSRKTDKAAWIVFGVGALVTLAALIVSSLVTGGMSTYWIIYGVALYFCVFFLGS